MPVVRFRFKAGSIVAARLPHRVVKDARGDEWIEVLGKDLFAGPGFELKRLLSGFPFYIASSESCACNRRARHMDKMGCDWCEQNVLTIVGWLQEEHARQKLLVPFISLAAEQLVRLAIRRARKKGIK